MGKPQQIGRLVLVELMVASLSIRSFIILVFSVFYNRIKIHVVVGVKCGHVVLYIENKLEYVSSIVFHTVLVAREYVKISKTKKCGYIA